ncbi:hypothetical protein [Sphingobacterium corticibacter]|uniref:Uncharacterized protein n=1 Tax=Sphingobacterium corticibacter TaxID=2171749 RepID=A0A2T8HNI0_9SPHI|nr:hypothetical protein DC487_05140 [Sphingobacterium corticibacter]
MQSKENLTKQATPEANGVALPHADLLADLDPQEIQMVVADYHSDKHTKICPECEVEVSPDNLIYITDEIATWGEPEYGHTECPQCGSEISPSDLEKPSFDYWLKLTA